MNLKDVGQIDPALERSFRGHKGAVNCVAFNPSMKQIASGGADKMVMLWNFKPQLRAFKFAGHRGPVHGIDFAKSGRFLASCSNGEIRLWQPNVMGESRSLKAHLAPVRSIKFSNDERFLISASDDKSCKIWDVGQYRFKSTLRGHSHWVRSAVFSPDGLLAASGSDDKTVKLWDLQNQEIIRTFWDHNDVVTNVAFHPEGTLLASCSMDNSIKLWDVRSSKLLQHYNAHDAGVNSIDFHPSGAFLISASDDRSLKVWDLTAGHQMYTIHGHEEPTTCVSFSPKGDYFATTAKDSLVLVWKSNFDKLLEEEKPQAGAKPATRATRKGRSTKSSDRPTSPRQTAPKVTRTPNPHTPQPMPSARVARSAKVPAASVGPPPPNAASYLPNPEPVEFTSAKKVKEMDAEERSVPSHLTETLQNIVDQLNLMAATMGVFDERMSHQEGVLSKLEELVKGSATATKAEPHAAGIAKSPLKMAAPKPGEPVLTVPPPTSATSAQAPLKGGISLPSVQRLLRGSLTEEAGEKLIDVTVPAQNAMPSADETEVAIE